MEVPGSMEDVELETWKEKVRDKDRVVGLDRDEFGLFSIN